ncbi:MAG: glycosyltransferase, partial [Theionarchaea archaeon]|nr:glycosyltransferase [Theionarchaea archaeon]
MLVGGLGTYAENMTRKFVEQGHDVCVFSLNTGDLPTHEIIRGVEVHRPRIANASRIFPLISWDLGNWGTEVKFFSDLFMYNAMSATKLANYLVRKEGYHFDIISYHDWLNSIAGMMVKDELNLPTVFHTHSTEWGRTGNGSGIISSLERESAMSSDGIV